MTPRRLTFATLAAALVVSSSAASGLGAQIAFTHLDTEIGFDQVYTNANNHSLGINWIDFNDDGWPDIFTVNDLDLSSHLYRNNRDGTFTLVDALLPPIPNVRMVGAIHGDVDNDGDDDIYIYTDHHDWDGVGVPNKPDGPYNILLENQFVENGNRVSTPLFVSAAGNVGLLDEPYQPLEGAVDYPGYRAFTAGFFDYDRDGWLDVFVGHFVPQGSRTESTQNRLYRNLGDGTFEDATLTSGLEEPGAINRNRRPTLAFAGVHLDEDLDPDMYVVNAIDNAPGSYDVLYRNVAGVFENTTALSTGVGDDAGAGMGIDVADVNLDGTWDVYITDLISNNNDESDRNVLYLGRGDGLFTDNRAEQRGVSSVNSWGTNFFDADHDGDEDLFVATMGILRDNFFANDGNGFFTNVSTSAGFAFAASQRGSAVADFDRDGDLDIAVISGIEGVGLQLYRNDTQGGGNWLQVQLDGVESNRNAIGAVVKLRFEHPTEGTTNIKRQLKGGISAHSTDELLLHFGLADATVATEVRILWPSGQTTILNDVPVNQAITVVEGEAGWQSMHIVGR